ncbi:MAG: DegT/DnrJ/EryC1/StrS family aminotransferase [Armatimonadetes bacterium]|nr:DegT/DnrJ/EryC1/StrS family aminotransferase [Armatimonadota bacterium]
MSGPGVYWMGEEERQEVLDVLSSGYLFRYGKEGHRGFKAKAYTLEQEYARYSGVDYCIAVSSGTASLVLALQAMGIGPGDEVIVPAYTFIAGYTSMIHVGAMPVLAEIDESLTLDPDDIEHRITANTKAILPVHMLGNQCDMDAIMEIAKRHGLQVIEDSCQANGASYHGDKIGTRGAMGCFSLNCFKTISCGDGGLLITNDVDLYERAFAFHDQGHRPNRAGVEVGNRQVLGLNFRITELTSAVALAQLRKLDKIVGTLRAKKKRFRDAIGDIRGMAYRTIHDPDGECATLLTVIFDNYSVAKSVAEKLGTTTIDRSGWHVYSNMEHVMNFMAAQGCPCRKGAYPRTDDILSRAINLSVGVVDAGIGAAFGININSTDDEIDQTGEEFRAVCQECTDTQRSFATV